LSAGLEFSAGGWRFLAFIDARWLFVEIQKLLATPQPPEFISLANSLLLRRLAQKNIGDSGCGE